METSDGGVYTNVHRPAGVRTGGGGHMCPGHGGVAQRTQRQGRVHGAGVRGGGDRCHQGHCGRQWSGHCQAGPQRVRVEREYVGPGRALGRDRGGHARERHGGGRGDPDGPDLLPHAGVHGGQHGLELRACHHLGGGQGNVRPHGSEGHQC